MAEKNNSKNLSKIEIDGLIATCERLRANSTDPSTEAELYRVFEK